MRALWLGLATTLFFGAPASAQDLLSLGTNATTPGSDVDLLVTMTHGVVDGVGGLSFGIDHDEGVVDLASIQYVGPTFPDFLAASGGPGDPFGSLIVVFSLGAPVQTLMPGTFPVAVATYNVPPGAPLGGSSVPFAIVGTPPITVEYATPGGPVVPATQPGRIEIVAPPAAGTVGNQLGFPNGGDDTVSILDPNGAVVATPSGAPDESPVGVAVAANGLTWVTFEDTDTVIAFDPAGNIVTTVPTGDAPTGIAIDSEGNIWIANSGDGTVTKLSSTGQVLYGGDGPPVGSPDDGLLGPAIPVGDTPRGIAVDLIDNVWVATTGEAGMIDGMLIRLNPDGQVAQELAIPAGSLPTDVVVDSDGFVWVSLQGVDQVEQRASDGSVVQTYTLPMGASPTGIAVRFDPATLTNQIWVAGNGDGNLYLLGADGSVTSFPIGTQPSGVTVDGNGQIWVTDAASGEAFRVDPTDGSVDVTVPIGSLPGFIGDASGYTLALVILPEDDLDSDGSSNTLELEVGSNPFDTGSTPLTVNPGFVEPVMNLAASVTGKDLTLTWTNGGAYDGLTIIRTDSMGTETTFPLAGGDETLMDSPGLGLYTYTVVASAGGNDSPSRTVPVAIGPGQILDSSSVELGGLATNLFGITADPAAGPGEPLIYTVDAANELIYGLDENLDVVTIIQSPFPTPQSTAGLALDPDGGPLQAGSLYVGTGSPTDQSIIQEISIVGEIITGALPLEDLAGPITGNLGGLGFHDDSDFLLAVGPDGCEIFSLTPIGLGMIEQMSSFVHPDPAFGLNGVDFSPDSAFDAAGGRVQITNLGALGFEIAEVEVAMGMAEFTGSVPAPLFALQGTENAFGGFVFTEESIYVVGLTTSTIYEIAPPSDGGIFIRGDSDADGVFNGVVDGVVLLAYAFIPGSPIPPCIEAVDADADGQFNGVVDAVFLLACAFIPGSPCMPPPYPACGLDPDPANSLGCEGPTACQ